MAQNLFDIVHDKVYIVLDKIYIVYIGLPTDSANFF